MLKNIYLELEYDGSGFFGWQIQSKSPRIRTVQAELEKAIERLFNNKIRVVYSGRTDRGVHAKSQVVNFKINTQLLPQNIKKALNSFLPADIYVKKVKFVNLDFHSRFSVKLKTYRYLILNKKDRDVFLRNYTWWVPQKLDIKLMKRISKLLVGERDFSLFSKGASKYKSCLRKVEDISLKKKGSLIIVDVSACGFLRGMVRAIVGFLVRASLKGLNFKEAKEILEKNKYHPLVKPAPASGLYLYKIIYDKKTY